MVASRRKSDVPPDFPAEREFDPFLSYATEAVEWTEQLAEHGADPERVLIDHVEEHTIRPVLDAGYWCGMTLYPVSKCTPQRGVDMIEMYGDERIRVNSAGDWGPSPQGPSLEKRHNQDW